MTEFPPAHKEVRVILGYASSNNIVTLLLRSTNSSHSSELNEIALQLNFVLECYGE